MTAPPRSRSLGQGRAAMLVLVLTAGFSMGDSCSPPPTPVPGSGSALFESPQVNPVALSADGTRLYVANTTSGTVSVVDVSNPLSPVQLAQIPVGVDPVGIAVRPKVNPGDAAEDERIFVTNHISDSISVISRTKLHVIQTIQGLDANGVTTTDEPVGIAFASPTRAFVALDQPNQILVLDLDGPGTATINATRLNITNQAPRAIAVANNRLYVAAFESGNETEFPLCPSGDPRGLDLNNPNDQGCQFKFTPQFIAMFAASPNVGGRVIHDTDIPDRDLFVFNATTLAPVGSPIEGLSTLLYGVAVGNAGNRVYVTSTDARNLQNGLTALGNRMFVNRISFLDCQSGCTSYTAPTHVDLDASAPGALTVPTPYGIAASADGVTLVVTSAGADGDAGFPGLYTLNAAGQFVGSVVTGAIPQGVALRSNPGTGAAETAYVLNTVASTISIVDVSNPAAPVVRSTLSIGSDPTPTAVKNGRIAFNSARASTSGNFSCESCHPAGNTDQLLWTINTNAGPGGTDPNGAHPEPRTTMPVRGLRDTLPLHWDGTLADPIAGVFVPGDTAPDCNLAVDGEVGCIRDIVDASLSGVMCSQPACANGPAGLPGALTAQQRNDLAAFLGSVSFPPSPKRRPTDALSSTALQGARDLFTNDDGGGLVALTCSDVDSGCHALPLGVITNSSVVGGFDAPSLRGMWDRYMVFSNALFSSQEMMVAANTALPGENVWVPTQGITDRGNFLGTFPNGFTPAYNVPGTRIWEFINEMSVGLPALLGRQVQVTPANANLAATATAMTQLETAATTGKITAVLNDALIGELRFKPSTGKWTSGTSGAAYTGADLRAYIASGTESLTITARLPENVQAGGPRQPLLSPQLPDPGTPNVPRPIAGTTATLVLAHAYVDSTAKVLVDGSPCAGCSFTLPSAGVISLVVSPVPAAGAHVVQVLNPNGLASNEMPIISQ